jgi:hypothetical protein
LLLLLILGDIKGGVKLPTLALPVRERFVDPDNGNVGDEVRDCDKDDAALVPVLTNRSRPVGFSEAFV